MKEVSVFHGAGNPHRAPLQQALVAVKKRAVRVYRTHVMGAASYVFTTTSKDVHLGLGVLDVEALRTLGAFLNEEFKDGGTELLLSLDQDSQGRKEALLVTMTCPEALVLNFTLSPVH